MKNVKRVTKVLLVIVGMPALLFALLVGACELGLMENQLCFDSGRLGGQFSAVQPNLVPRWSPDGGHIVFRRPWGSILDSGTFWTDESDVYVIGSDGTKLRPLSVQTRNSCYDREHHFAASFSPDGSRVLYAWHKDREVKDADGNDYWKIDFDIETSRLDGSDRRVLAGTFADEVSPVWSTDGGRIAFFSRQEARGYRGEAGGRIFIMNADGSDVRMVVDLQSPWEGIESWYHRGALIWSPNGETLAFIMREILAKRNVDDPTIWREALYAVGTDGSDLKPLFVGTDHNFIFGDPVWSSDGREVAFVNRSERGIPLTLHAVRSDGSSLRQLAELDAQVFMERISIGLSWSPHRGEILVSQLSAGGGSTPEMRQLIQVVSVDGTGARDLVGGTMASWSPDGSRIAVLDIYGRESYLYTVSPDGSAPQVLVTDVDGKLRASNESERCLMFICW